MTPLRLVFFGTPAFALPCLEALISAGHDVVGVYSQAPRPAGRGRKERPSPVHEFAADRGIAVTVSASLKPRARTEFFAAMQPDAAIVVAYGLLLPSAFLEAPRLGCLNLHASLLPRWRGAAPIQHAILAGDLETGISIMRMDEGLDTGDILSQTRVPIAADDTAETLHASLAELGARFMVRTLAAWNATEIEPVPQREVDACYAPRLRREDGRLDWRRPARDLERQMRAFTPWPGAWFVHGAERIKLLTAELAADETAIAPGTVVDDRLTVACGEGALRLLHVQRGGRAAMHSSEMLRGHPIPCGTRLPSPA